MGERHKGEKRKKAASMSRRRFLGVLAGSGAGAGLLAVTSCALLNENRTPAVVASPDSPRTYTDTITKFYSGDLAEMGLGELAAKPAVVSPLNIDIPTTVLNYSPGVDFNPAAIKAGFSLVSRAGLPDMIEALESGKTDREFFREGSVSLFRYDYSLRPQALTTVVGLSSAEAATHSRLMLYVGNDTKPDWMDEAALTVNFIKQGATDRREVIHVTAINTDLSPRGSELLQRQTLTEIAQSSLLVVAFRGRGIVVPNTDIVAAIAQEGVGNTLGLAASRRLRAEAWPAADRYMKSIQIKTPNIPEPFRAFNLTEAAYSLIPGDPMAVKK